MTSKKLIKLLKKYKTSPNQILPNAFASSIIFDTETTGLKQDDQITEISALYIQNCKLQKQLHCFINISENQQIQYKQSNGMCISS